MDTQEDLFSCCLNEALQYVCAQTLSYVSLAYIQPCQRKQQFGLRFSPSWMRECALSSWWVGGVSLNWKVSLAEIMLKRVMFANLLRLLFFSPPPPRGTLTCSYLSHSEQLAFEKYQYVDCRGNATLPGMSRFQRARQLS